MSYLALGLVAGLAAVERKGFLQAMLSRPIILGLVTGVVLGHPAEGLLVAVPLEFLWLGAVNLGAALPVHEVLGTAAIAGGTVLGAAALRQARPHESALLLPAAAVIAVVVCAPLALLGRRTERLVERFNERLYARAERDIAEGDSRAAARVNLYGLVLPFGIAFVLAPLGAAAARTVAWLAGRTSLPLSLPAAGWIGFSAFACAAGAKAMRGGHAQVVYFVAMGLGLCLLAAAALAGGRS